MNPGDPSPTRVIAYLDLLSGPAFRWSQTESDEETEQIWLQLCHVMLGDVPSEALKWLRNIDPPQQIPPTSLDQIAMKSHATDCLELLRASQKYWGIGVAAANELGEVGAWSGKPNTSGTISALRFATFRMRELEPSLETALTQHATDRVDRRVDLCLATMPPDDAEVLVRRFGWRGERRETLAEIARSRNLSRERIRQIEVRALRRMGPEAANQLCDASAAEGRSEALDRAFQSLSTRPGEDVHHVDDLLNLASEDEAWWRCGVARLSDASSEAPAEAESLFVWRWLMRRPEAVKLGVGGDFLRRSSENRSPYIKAARKLLAVHESIPIEVVHQAILDTWRNQLWAECKLSPGWLRDLFESSSLAVEEERLVRTGPVGTTSVLSATELKLLVALQQLGGVADLAELRELLPDLRRQGSTLKQTLYGRTPIVQRIGPSIFGVRGAVHDQKRIATLEDRAHQQNHPWIDRGGWNQDERRSLRYRLPSRGSLPDRIRLPLKVAESFFTDEGRSVPLTWRTSDGVDHLVGVQNVPAGIFLTGVRPILRRLRASAGDTVEIVVQADDLWAVALAEKPPAEAIVIRIGRGWSSVSL